jgi:hypothetical protein
MTKTMNFITKYNNEYGSRKTAFDHIPSSAQQSTSCKQTRSTVNYNKSMSYTTEQIYSSLFHQMTVKNNKHDEEKRIITENNKQNTKIIEIKCQLNAWLGCIKLIYNAQNCQTLYLKSTVLQPCSSMGQWEWEFLLQILI